jgi:hypothetical protein
MINIKNIKSVTNNTMLEDVRKEMNSCVQKLRAQSTVQGLDHEQKVLIKKFILLISAKQMLDTNST